MKTKKDSDSRSRHVTPVEASSFCLLADAFHKQLSCNEF